MKRKPRAYVVDDDPAVVGALASLISVIGFDVETFTSAEEFLQTFEAGGPACLILDVRLPGMSGLELQKALIRRGSRLPIIFITGHGEADAAVEASKLGAVGFLEKPFQTQELFDNIQKAVAVNTDNGQCRPH